MLYRTKHRALFLLLTLLCLLSVLGTAVACSDSPDTAVTSDTADGSATVGETEPEARPTETPTEVVTDPATEPTTDPATEPTTDPATDPATAPATEPATDPVTEPATEPATEPETEAVGMRLDSTKVTRYIGGTNQVSATMVTDPTEGTVLKMSTNNGGLYNDPFVEFSYGTAAKQKMGDVVSLEEYPYLILKVRCENCSSATFDLFWAAGSQVGITGESHITAMYDNGDDGWQYILFDMSARKDWTGKLNTLRFDYEINAAGPGETMYLSSIRFAKDRAEVLACVGNPEDPSVVETDPELESRVDDLLKVPDAAPEIDNAPVRAEQEDEGISLWFNHSYTKTPAEDTTPTGMTTYLMRLARNEIEDCHLLLSSAEGRTGLTVSVSDFKNADGVTLVTDLMYAYYFDDVDGQTIPDPTPWVREGKTFDLAAGRSQIFIIKVHTTADSPAGLYEATVTVRDADGNEVKRAVVSAYVWGFTLPEETSCKTLMDLSWWNIYSAHKCYEGDDSLLYKNYYDYLLENRICAYTLPYDDKGYFGDSRILPYLNDPRVVAFNPIGWTTAPTADNVGAAFKYLSQKEEWLKKSYFYVVDEPIDQAALDRVNWVGGLLKENFPGYKMLSPEHVNYALNAESTEDHFSAVKDSINVWCYKPYFYTTFAEHRYSAYTGEGTLTYSGTPMLEKNLGTFAERMKAEQAGGDELWWYVTRRPESPEITLLMETQAVRYRILFWQQKLYGVDGFLYYSVNDWYMIGENQGLNSKHEVTGEYDVYGNGVLLYCGSNFDEYGPVGCLRLESVRDGIEDYEYLCMLEDIYGTELVNTLIGRLTTSLSHYSTDEELFTQLRIAVGNLLDQAAAE